MSAFAGKHSSVDSLMFARLVDFAEVILNMVQDWTDFTGGASKSSELQCRY